MARKTLPRGSATANLGRAQVTKTGYRWTDVDEFMGDFVSLIRNSTLSLEMIAAESGVHIQTLHNWLEFQVRQPIWPTRRAVMKVLGENGQKKQVMILLEKTIFN